MINYRFSYINRGKDGRKTSGLSPGICFFLDRREILDYFCTSQKKKVIVCVNTSYLCGFIDHWVQISGSYSGWLMETFLMSTLFPFFYIKISKTAGLWQSNLLFLQTAVRYLNICFSYLSRRFLHLLNLSAFSLFSSIHPYRSSFCFLLCLCQRCL